MSPWCLKGINAVCFLFLMGCQTPAEPSDSLWFASDAKLGKDPIARGLVHKVVSNDGYKNGKIEMKPASKAMSRDLRDRICKAKGHDLKVSITAVLPKSKPGTPLDKAQIEQAEARKRTKRAVQGFFHIHDQSESNSLFVEQWQVGTTQAEITKALKGNIYYTPEYRLDSARVVDRPGAFFVVPETSRLLFTAAPRTQWDDSSQSGIVCCTNIFARDPKADAKQVGDATALRYTSMLQGEMALLAQNYTFMPPEGISPSKALSSQREFWNDYVDRYTSTKESQTEDPQVIDYSVSLAMDRFCEFGKHLDDLTAK